MEAILEEQLEHNGNDQDGNNNHVVSSAHNQEQSVKLNKYVVVFYLIYGLHTFFIRNPFISNHVQYSFFLEIKEPSTHIFRPN